MAGARPPTRSPVPSCATTGSAPSSAPRSGRASAPGSACSTWCRRPVRTRWSATSAPTCSARTGTCPRRWRNLRRDPQRAIGEALLDQRLLAGIGTLYDCRVAVPRSGIHPWTPVGELDDHALERLVERAHRLLEVNSHRAVQSTTGQPRPGETGLCARPVGSTVPALRHGDPGRDDRPGTAGPDDVLLPHLPGRPGTDRRRPDAAPDGLHRRRQAGGAGRSGQAPDGGYGR